LEHFIAPIVILVLLFFMSSIKVVREYENYQGGELMRKIKFRAWDKFCNAWAKNSMDLFYNRDGTFGLFGGDRYNIQQFTGCYDVNGQEIYEGDIVSFADVTDTESGYSEYDCIGVVEWDKNTASFNVTNRLSCESYEVLDDGCIVVGNIYENPELFEGREGQ